MVRKIGLIVLGLGFFLFSWADRGVAGDYTVYTVQQLIADIQTITKGSRDLNDSVWLEIVNLGLDNLSSKADCSVDTFSLLLVVGTAEYSLPANFQKLWDVNNKTTERSYDMIPMEGRLKATTGFEVEEEKVYAWGHTLGFSKSPVREDSVLVYYFKKPFEADSVQDTLDVLPVYNYALKIACRLELWDRVERGDKANSDRVLLINEINNTKAYLASRPPDIIIGQRLIPRDAE